MVLWTGFGEGLEEIGEFAQVWGQVVLHGGFLFLRGFECLFGFMN